MNLRLRFGPRRASFRRPLFRRREGPAHDVLTGPIRGELLGVEGQTVKLRAKDSEIYDLPFADIASAKLVLTDKLIQATAPLNTEGADNIETVEE